MSEKNLKTLTAICIAVAMIATMALILYQAVTPTAATPIAMEYETEIFNGEIFSVDILADDETWQHIIDTATDEQYTAVDVVVNGTLFKNVGIRPKGNSSLQFIAMDPDTDRFSFKIKFDEYIDGQTCFGLDVLVLNNLYEDNSYLREYISFDMMNELGVDAPLYTYADVTLNGDPWGLYLGLESYNSSFQKRVYGNSNGYLYSAKAADIVGGGNMMPSAEMFSGNGLDLKYVGNDLASYAGFFENSIGSTADRADNTRVVEAIEVLNNYESLDELEEYWDMEQIIPYLAAHTVSVNGDSYSTFMCQNYFLYEQNGKVSILPWDYSSTFGILFMTDDASDIVNFPIDTPVFGVEMADRPLLEVVMENEVYKQQYHESLSILAAYLQNIDDTAAALNALIDDYVKNDATAFCTYEEFEAARDELIQLLLLRGESIAGQIDGTVPATTDAQAANPEKLINSDDLDLSLLTSPKMKGGMPPMGPSSGDGAARPMKGGMPPMGSSSGDGAAHPMKGGMPPMGMNGEMPDIETMKEMMMEMGLEAEMVDEMLAMMHGDQANPIQIAVDAFLMITLIAITLVAVVFIKKS